VTLVATLNPVSQVLW